MNGLFSIILSNIIAILVFKLCSKYILTECEMFVDATDDSTDTQRTEQGNAPVYGIWSKDGDHISSATSTLQKMAAE